MNMTKMLLLCGVLARIAGCKYEPDCDTPFGYPVDESSEYALAPNARWTSLRYNQWTPLNVEGVWEMRILLDSHRIQFVKFDDGWGMERPRIVSDQEVSADKWTWIVGKLEEAGVSRWKTSYWPGGGVSVLDGTGWTLEFMDGSNVVGKAAGSNAWPKNFKAFLAIVDAFDDAGVARRRRGASYINRGGDCCISL